MPKDKYLTSAIPEPDTKAKTDNRSGTEDRFAALESRLEELNQLLIKQQRDDQDYRDNIDEDNLSESLLKTIEDLKSRVTALENNNQNP